jgi:hypothetical protein
MTHRIIATIAAAGAITLAAFALNADDGDSEESKIQQGFRIAPVPLTLIGKNRDLVGLGSYIVNAQSDCNGCHNGGQAAPQYLPIGNPYLLPPPGGPFGGTKITNQASYLGGGRDFGAFPADPFPHIISRNLTPDRTGRPEGGTFLNEFIHIMRTGEDMDHLHPTCTGAPNGHCIPKPFDGSRLQIMPWPAYKDMTDRDLMAIYEYLSAIPCIPGPPAPDPRHHDCH